MSDVRRLPVGEEDQGRVTLDELAREGARRMIATALEAEVQEYVGSFTGEVDEDGKRLVVRNGRARERRVTVGSGTVPVRAPRVNDKRVDEKGERKRFSSRILPAYARRSPKVTEVLPILYLHGLSTGDFGPALRDLLGEDASGLSSSSIQRLTEQWQAEHAAFGTRELRFHRYAYLFVDGVNVSVRLGEDPKLCLLVVIGVREDGCKELLAVEDGYRESEDSWAAVFRDLRDRGLNEPKLMTGDGALGAWAALRSVFPATTEQRCWVHKTANALDALPKRLQPRAKSLLHEMAEAPSQADARKALERFRSEFDAKYPKAVAKLDKDWDTLTAFYDFPAEHWRHLRTTNPIESSFATVKLRTKVTKGAGSKKAALAMAYKLLDAAQGRWRRFNGHELVTDVLDGVKFNDGIKVTEDETTTTDEKVAA
jgi:putative transposase